MFEMIRSLLLPKTSIPVKLFSEGLKNENSGDFQKAIGNYETALEEVNKSPFNNSNLKIKITEKIKVLTSVTEFEKNSKRK